MCCLIYLFNYFISNGTGFCDFMDTYYVYADPNVVIQGNNDTYGKKISINNNVILNILQKPEEVAITDETLTH